MPVAKTTPKKPTKAKSSASSSTPKKHAPTLKGVGMKTPAKKPTAKTAKAVTHTPARGAPSPSRVITKPVKAAPVAATKAVKPVSKDVKERAPERPERPARTPITAPMASSASDKFAKNQAGLKAKDLEFFRDLLLAKRRELVGDVHSMEQEALRSTTGSNLSNLPIHMADMGTDNYEQEFTLGLVEKDRQLLREINVALDKVRNGTYGICEGTGQPINRVRLEAQPWARYSIEYARQLEKGLIRRIG
jgi:RNA polymerase-binding protein DksA